MFVYLPQFLGRTEHNHPPYPQAHTPRQEQKFVIRGQESVQKGAMAR
jgi:hypothetical protein